MDTPIACILVQQLPWGLDHVCLFCPRKVLIWPAVVAEIVAGKTCCESEEQASPPLFGIIFGDSLASIRVR